MFIKNSLDNSRQQTSASTGQQCQRGMFYPDQACGNCEEEPLAGAIWAAICFSHIVGVRGQEVTEELD